MIFQEPMTSLNPVLRVGRQVVEAIRLHESVSKPAARDRRFELFKKVGIPTRASARPIRISSRAVLKQRVMIAMAPRDPAKLSHRRRATTALDVTIRLRSAVIARASTRFRVVDLSSPMIWE